MLLLFTIIITVVVVEAVLMSQSKSQSSESKSPSLSPSLSTSAFPSISSAPTFFYQDYVRQLVLPISGKETLDSPTSRQHFAWKTVAANLRLLVDLDMVSLDDTDEIIQRYCVLVTTEISRSTGFRPGISSFRFPKPTCEIYLCNDKNEVTTLVLINELKLRVAGGTIAKEIGELKGLATLIWIRSGMKGTLPTELGKLKNLKYLALHDNFLTGTIPTELGLLQYLELLLLNSIQLTKTIPTEVGNLTNLIYMDVSDNLLTGAVPMQLDHVEDLDGLGLYGNKQLMGSIEFLCQTNVTRSGNYFQEVFWGDLRGTHMFSMENGIMIDCMNNDPVLECSCCMCMA